AVLCLEKDVLLPRLLQFVGKQTGEDVGGTACGIGHDEGDAPAWIGVRRRCRMRRGAQGRRGDGREQSYRGRRAYHADRQMIVHGHTPDCRHSTDKPARLDSNDAFLYIAAVQLGTWFLMRSAHSANLPQPTPIPTHGVNALSN